MVALPATTRSAGRIRWTVVAVAFAAIAAAAPAVASAGYKEKVLATNPEAYWGLGETAGLAVDHARAHHGGYHEANGSLGVTTRRGVAGAPIAGPADDGGFAVSGNVNIYRGQYGGGTVAVGTYGSWGGRAWRSAFSVNVWMRWDGYNTFCISSTLCSDLTQGIVGNHGDAYSDGGWALDIPGKTGGRGDGRIRFLREIFHVEGSLLGPALPRGEWTMVTASYDGLTMRLYFNGALVASQRDPYDTFGGYSTLYIGGQDYNRFFSGYWGNFKGTLDEVTYWKRTLTDGEVQAIFDAARKPPEKPILFFVPGMAGSELKVRTAGAGDFAIWPDAILASGLPAYPDLVEALSVRDDGTTSMYDVYASKVQDTAFGSDIYGEAMDGFAALERAAVVSEFVRWPYDWRLGVRNAGQRLALDLIARCRDERAVWVVSHSTGGLVLKTALRIMRETNHAPEACFKGGGVFFFGVPHGGAAKAIGAMINPDLFFGAFLQQQIAAQDRLAHVENNWLTAWELMPPRTNNHDPFASREGWFNNANDGLGDKNVNGDQLNWVLDEKANHNAPYAYDYSSTVGALPVYNVFGYSGETPGVYEPGACRTIAGQRVYTSWENNVHLRTTIYGDGTVPVWSALWPGSRIPDASQYAISHVAHGDIPEQIPALLLLSWAIQGADHPDVAGLAHGRTAVALGDAAQRLKWRTDICSPVAAIARHGGGELGSRPDGSIVRTTRDALYEPGAEESGFKYQTFVIPQNGPTAPPTYELTAIGDGRVSIWQTDPDGSRHDFVFDARKGDKAALRRGAAEWELAIDRGGDGSVDQTLVANTLAVRIPQVTPVPEGGAVELRAEGGSPNGAPVVHRWELVSGNGTLSGDGGTATYRPDDGPSTARIRVVATDESGGRASAETTVDVVNVAPSVEVDARASAPWGVPVGLRGVVSDPSAADRAAGLRSQWGFGDGSAGGDGTEATHAYFAPGSYTATLTAQDKDGAAGAASTAVTISARRAALTWTGSTTAIYGFERLAVRVSDPVDAATARLGDLAVAIAVGETSLEGRTGADGAVEVQPALPLAPASHAVSARLLSNELYDTAQTTATVAVENGRGRVTGGVGTHDGSRAAFSVQAGAGTVKGELEYHGADGHRLHISEFDAFGVAPDGRSSWFAGRTNAGVAVVVHVTEARPNRFVLWIGGARQPGSGDVSSGTLQIQK